MKLLESPMVLTLAAAAVFILVGTLPQSLAQKVDVAAPPPAPSPTDTLPSEDLSSPPAVPAQTSSPAHPQDAGREPGSDGEVDPIVRLNEFFRESYALEKQRIIQGTEPVIVIAGDESMLLCDGRREVVTYVPHAFHILKTVDHVAVSLFVELRDSAGRKLTAGEIDRLRELKRLVATARPSIDSAELSPAARQRQNEILDRSMAFLDGVLSRGNLSEKELLSFTTGIRPLLMANVDDATAMELQRLDEVVRGFRRKMTDKQWSELHVVVTGGHMPREQETKMQYFSKLLGERREGGRLVYLEGSSDEMLALDLMATHILDGSMATAFFDDRWRMHRDLLSDAAARYLRKHPPQQLPATR